jgi:hypothetical protein
MQEKLEDGKDMAVVGGKPLLSMMIVMPKSLKKKKIK